MRLNRLGLAAAFVATLLAFGTVATLAAQDEGSMDMEKAPVTLTGQLNESADGGYTLVEPESGEEIVVDGPGLADHVGSEVTVTGTWETDEDGNTYLAVTEVKESDAS